MSREPIGDINLEMLKEFSEAHGISGNEKEVSRVMKKWIEPYADEITYDNLGSLVALQKGDKDGVKVMIAGHMDEVGFMVCDIDKDGYIFISGRKKFVIVLKNGKNIYPEELEALLNKIDGVKESFVFGYPEDDGDYKIHAKIVYDKETVGEIYNTEDPEKLKELIWQEVKKVNKTMPAYKYIREITLTDKELIKTTTQKVKRFEEIKTVLK